MRGGPGVHPDPTPGLKGRRNGAAVRCVRCPPPLLSMEPLTRGVSLVVFVWTTSVFRVQGYVTNGRRLCPCRLVSVVLNHDRPDLGEVSRSLVHPAGRSGGWGRGARRGGGPKRPVVGRGGRILYGGVDPGPVGVGGRGQAGRIGGSRPVYGPG